MEPLWIFLDPAGGFQLYDIPDSQVQVYIP